MILKKIAVFLSVVFFTVIIFLQPIAANFKAVLLISQEFPQHDFSVQIYTDKG